MKYSPQPLHFIGRKTTWFRPVNLEQLLKLKSKYPDSKIVSGNTEVGIETKFKKMKYDIQIFIGDISELKTCDFQGKISSFLSFFFTYLFILNF